MNGSQFLKYNNALLPSYHQRRMQSRLRQRCSTFNERRNNNTSQRSDTIVL